MSELADYAERNAQYLSGPTDDVCVMDFSRCTLTACMLYGSRCLYQPEAIVRVYERAEQATCPQCGAQVTGAQCPSCGLSIEEGSE